MTREWVPETYLDEVTPPPRDTAQDWIEPGPFGGWRLAGWEDVGVEPHDLSDGEMLPFHWTEHFGHAVFTVEDGKWSVSRQPPEGTTHICVGGDPDTLYYGDSIDGFAKQYLDGGTEDVETELDYYTWSDSPIIYEFRDGKLHVVEPATA